MIDETEITSDSDRHYFRSELGTKTPADEASVGVDGERHNLIIL